MVAVMKIEFSDIDESESLVDQILRYVEMFFTFEISQLSFSVCPVEGLTALGKHLLRVTIPGWNFRYLAWNFSVCPDNVTTSSKEKITFRNMSFIQSEAG